MTALTLTKVENYKSVHILPTTTGIIINRHVRVTKVKTS